MVSVPLVLECEAAAKRIARKLGLTARDVDAVLDDICDHAVHCRISCLWRPALKDPGDDMVLELAVAAECFAVVTFNTRDYAGAEKFGIRVMTPRAWLAEIGEP